MEYIDFEAKEIPEDAIENFCNIHKAEFDEDGKDKKFQEERIKFRQTLRELEKEVNFKNKKIDELKIENTELESKIRELQEWIDRLLEFTELSKEQINDMIQTDKIIKKYEEMGSVFNAIFGGPSSIYR